VLSDATAAAINHLLRDADWARTRLQAFVGCTVRFEIPPVSAAFTVGADGCLLPLRPETEPATVVRFNPGALFRLFWLHDEAARQDARVEGDTAFASALTGVLSGLRWDPEEDLSRLVGDVAAHRLKQGASGLLTWQSKAASNLAHALVEYWTEERPLLVGGQALSQFLQAVDALRDDAERLEKRVERIARSLAARADA